MQRLLGPLRRWLGAAVAWTMAQHLAYFGSAWLVSALAGAAAFGEFGQALALALIGSLAVSWRLDYAAQLARREGLAQALFVLAERLCWGMGALVAVSVVLAWALGKAPAWLLAGGLAVTPLALLLAMAARQVRVGNVVKAAALRALPALLMLPLQALLAGGRGPDAVVWSVPLAAWLVWGGLRARAGAAPVGPGVAGFRRLRRAAGVRWHFVRAEWPSLMLNTAANHGQVLLVGALAGDVAAGAMALALRLAMLPTSLFAPALADALRARVVAGRTRGAARALVARVLPGMAGASVAVHALAWVVLPVLCAWFFAPQGRELVQAARLLLWLGALRLLISPLAFLLAWRGWVGLNLLGQSLLFAAALGAAWWGVPRGGVPAVAGGYALAAAGVYLGYLWASWRALQAGLQGDNRGLSSI
ncbi:MAG: hypothetical protein IPG98_08045 [Burkholderiales bacterium]|nr:hypothetical protein [Burkholderiales bacterium]MBK8665988.1 hypothetical protein [Burkholderiales bacterium]